MSWRKALQNNWKCAFEFLIYYFWGRGQLLLICTTLPREWNAAGLLLLSTYFNRQHAFCRHKKQPYIAQSYRGKMSSFFQRFCFSIFVMGWFDRSDLKVGNHFEALEYFILYKLAKNGGFAAIFARSGSPLIKSIAIKLVPVKREDTWRMAAFLKVKVLNDQFWYA